MPEGQRPDPASLHAPGLADAHGVLAIASGAATLMMSLYCGLERGVGDDYLLLTALLATVTVWVATFGIVSRGSPVGRFAATAGLVLVPLAALFWFVGVCLRG